MFVGLYFIPGITRKMGTSALFQGTPLVKKRSENETAGDLRRQPFFNPAKDSL
jgi:hypothetical protein